MATTAYPILLYAIRGLSIIAVMEWHYNNSDEARGSSLKLRIIQISIWILCNFDHYVDSKAVVRDIAHARLKRASYLPTLLWSETLRRQKCKP